MSTRNMIAEQAIKRSVSHTEIVTIDVPSKSSLEFLALSEMSDDWVSLVLGRYDVCEFWGTDDDGDEWRVHARIRGAL